MNFELMINIVIILIKRYIQLSFISLDLMSTNIALNHLQTKRIVN